MEKFSGGFFMHACGGDGPLRLKVTDLSQGQSRALVLDQPFAVIGRLPEADVVLSGLQVSKHHAFLQVIDGRPFLLDLGSRTGLSWDGKQRRAGWLDPGMCVQIGGHQVELAEDNRPPALGQSMVDPLAKSSVAIREVPAKTIEFIHGYSVQAEWTVNRILTLVGRSPWCKVRIHGHNFSQFHSALVWTSMGLWLVDLLAEEGLWVNGQKLRFTRLDDGDEVDLGDYQLRVKSAQTDIQPLAKTPLSEIRPPAASDQLVRMLETAMRENAALAKTAPAELTPNPASLLASIAGNNMGLYILPLVQQFADMQQNLIMQFQQVLLQMVQRFSGANQDQIKSLEAKLDHMAQMADTNRNGPVESRPGVPGRREPEDTARRSPSPAKETAPVVQNRAKNNPDAAGEEDMHAWLFERMETLQKEQKGGWSKFMDFLGGSGK